VPAFFFIVAVPGLCAGQAEPLRLTIRDELERRQARLPESPTERFSISGALLGTVQWIATSSRTRDDVVGAGSLDLNLIVRPTDWIRLFVDVEALIGLGPDESLGTLSRLHTDADRLEGREKRLILREAFVRFAWRSENVRFSVGKLDAGHYFDRNFFAEDETTQFLDSALLNSPMLKPPPNGPGAALRVSVGDWRYAVGVQAPDDVDGDLSGLPYFIAELGHRNIFRLPGHYRWWARVGSVPGDRDLVTWGTGVSIDQLLTPDFGVFFRAGLSRSEGQALTSRAWSGGLHLAPTSLGRGHDRFGIGYSWQRETAGHEELVEAYYMVSVAEWFRLTPNLQWLLSGPNQVRGGTNHNVVVPGLRALLLF
jgi:hypothetical protein